MELFGKAALIGFLVRDDAIWTVECRADEDPAYAKEGREFGYTWFWRFWEKSSIQPEIQSCYYGLFEISFPLLIILFICLSFALGYLLGGNV